MQYEAGVFTTISATDQIGRIRSENQADCVGGAFLGYLNKRGHPGARRLLRRRRDHPDDRIGGERPDRDHGTAQERVQSVNYGLRGGLDGCSPYFPSTPLVTRA